jgi:hypothetical protein
MIYNILIFEYVIQNYKLIGKEINVSNTNLNIYIIQEILLM